MKNHTLTAVCAFGLSLLCAGAQASQMVYTPVNPDFGGSPFNGSTLLNEANAQNHFQGPQSKTDLQQNFANTITSALLGQISTKIADSIYGPNAANSGTYVVGSTKIDFNHVNGNVVLTITDLANGQQTTVQVPSGI